MLSELCLGHTEHLCSDDEKQQPRSGTGKLQPPCLIMIEILSQGKSQHLILDFMKCTARSFESHVSSKLLESLLKRKFFCFPNHL